MSQVELVALWAGLIASIAGIVLSIVAITFSILVDRRSSKISDHTIQSLQKIESTVERLSSDTRELIKAGWDKMLGNFSGESPEAPAEIRANEISAGIVSELRSELKSLANESSEKAPSAKDIEGMIRNLETSLTTQLSDLAASRRPGEQLDRALMKLTKLSPPAKVLLGEISKAGRHISRDEYNVLLKTPLEGPLKELREIGAIIPVVHHAKGQDIPCYYFPPFAAPAIRGAIPLLEKPAESTIHDVRKELAKIRYGSHAESKGKREQDGNDAGPDPENARS